MLSQDLFLKSIAANHLLGEELTTPTEELVEKVGSSTVTVPRRLKPHCKCCMYGTGKPVPLSKTSGIPQAPSVVSQKFAEG
jgi:hypothetical protein